MIDLKLMIKFITLSFLILLQLFGVVEPAFAAIPPGAQKINLRPNYKAQVEFIIQNSCNAIGMVPYNGQVYYSCPSGEKFWSDVLAPTPDSPLFLYVKNRKRQDAEDAANENYY